MIIPCNTLNSSYLAITIPQQPLFQRQLFQPFRPLCFPHFWPDAASDGGAVFSQLHLRWAPPLARYGILREPQPAPVLAFLKSLRLRPLHPPVDTGSDFDAGLDHGGDYYFVLPGH